MSLEYERLGRYVLPVMPKEPEWSSELYKQLKKPVASVTVSKSQYAELIKYLDDLSEFQRVMGYGHIYDNFPGPKHPVYQGPYGTVKILEEGE